jgi:hypothetical protein
MRHEHLATLIGLRTRLLELIRGENPAEIFLHALSEAISSGRARIVTSPSDGSKHGPPIVGFKKHIGEDLTCVFPREAMGLVRDLERRMGREFDWTPNAVSKQLANLGALVTRQGRKDYGTITRFGGNEHRVWLIRNRWLGLTGWKEDELVT